MNRWLTSDALDRRVVSQQLPVKISRTSRTA